jgi:hypothetical protein
MALDTGPVDIFASSGGAVNGLALVAGHPEQVRTFRRHLARRPRRLMYEGNFGRSVVE